MAKLEDIKSEKDLPRDKNNASHHYIPQFYLEGFSRNNKLAVWNRLDGSVRISTPRNSACQHGFNTIELADGNKTSLYEDIFEKFETLAEPLIENMRCIFPCNPYGKQKYDISNYMSLQEVRTPLHRKRVEMQADMLYKMELRKELSNRDKILKFYRDGGTEPTEEQIQQTIDFVKNPHAVDILLNKGHVLQMSIESAFEISKYFFLRNWTILIFDKPSLIIGDAPILEIADPEAGFLYGHGLAGAKELIIPLSSTILLVMAKPKEYLNPLIMKGTYQVAEITNRNQLENCLSEAYGDPEILSRYKNFKLGPRKLMGFSNTAIDPNFLGHYNKPPKKQRPQR